MMDTDILDIHTHHAPPQPRGIVSVSPEDPADFPGQLYSVGIHPWDIRGISLTSAQLELLRSAASRGNVVAVGETGVDLVRRDAAPLAGQLNAFRAHAQLSEELGKPLVIHCVKGHDAVIAMKRQIRPAQPWIIHGFRGKPTVMRMLADEGIFLSFGAAFNPESLQEAPAELILAETDEAPVGIGEVIASLGAVRADATPALIADNIRRLFPE